MINFRPSNLRSNSRLIIIPIFIPRDTGCHRFRAAFKTITLSFRSISPRRRIKDSTGFEIWDANGRKNWTRAESANRFCTDDENFWRACSIEIWIAHHLRLFDHSIVFALSIPISPVIKHNLMASSPALGMKTRCRANGIDKSSRPYLNPGRRHSWNSSRSFLLKD